MIVNSNPAKFLAGLAKRRAIAAYREIQEKTMTKTTEELKREMYGQLKDLKKLSDSQASFQAAEAMENSLEEYLEALRQELQQWKDIADERDLRSANLRNKLQAFDFANRSASELLSEALREPSGLRKASQAIPQQESSDRASCTVYRTCDTLDYPSNVVPIFKLIRENTEYTLTSEQFEAFEQMLQSKPASENKALQELLSRKPGWNDGDQS